MSVRLEKQDKPPIIEVICGFVFPKIPLDPILIGAYWSLKRGRYPKRQLQPALVEARPDGPTIFFDDSPPLRVWFISRDDEFVIQLQDDRFYLNWRRRGQDYPSFSGIDKDEGVKALALQEFEEFCDFAEQEGLGRPCPTRIELAKVDAFPEGMFWTGTKELEALIPWLKQFLEFTRSESPGMLLRLHDERPAGNLTLTIEVGIAESSPGKKVRTVKLETRITQATKDVPLAQMLDEANAELNDEVFARLIPRSARDRFFKVP